MESTISSQLATNSSITNTQYQILGLTFWFSTPNSGSINSWPLGVLSALSSLLLILVLILIGFKLLSSKLTPPQQKFLTKAIWVLLPVGLVGWLLVLSRVVGVVFLSARFWWLLWLAGLIAGSVWLVRQSRQIPTQQLQYQTYQLKKRYFPKKRKK